MDTNLRLTRKSIAALAAMALLALLLPFTGAAEAGHGVTLDVEPEISRYNRNDVVTLTATLSAPAPVISGDRPTFIDWENEGGANDPDAADGTSYQTPDRTCPVPVGSFSCSITYPIPNATEGDASRPDVWRAWIDHDQTGTTLTSNNGNATTEADQEEGRNEQTSPGESPPSVVTGCPTEGETEPDCTDVVVVNVGGLEVVPDVQTVDAGTTARLTARLFGPAQPADGEEIDFENQNGPNDPDASNSLQTPDRSCTVPQGQTECFMEYPHVRGSDVWRVWIDDDKVESTVEADRTEGRFSGFYDCSQPEDPSNCTPGIPNPQPGDGCNFDRSDPADNDEPDPTEPDCTDVVQVSSRSGAPAMVDCDDQSGTGGQDSERETNPTRPSNTQTGDPSTERYRCTAHDQFGNPTGPGIRIKGENENGVNDPDRSGAVYSSVDYSCTTTFDEDDFFNSDENICYIEVPQAEGELGTAEICFYLGTAEEGATVCADEPTGEGQTAEGLDDEPNDAADQVEKTWANPSTFRLDCGPETDSNPAGTAHTITCTATSQTGATVSGVEVNAEASGTNDPDSSNTPAVTPDFECETGTDGTCSFTHGPGGTGSTGSQGTTTYRAWIDADRDDTTSEADATEGRNEDQTPGARAEPDNTDVVEKAWTPPPANVTMTPETDTATVGECNPYTITVTDRDGAAVPGAIIDVEQRHQLADNQTQNDEPSVSFCDPPASGGPNSSMVDESRGDGGGPGQQESPDNDGTAGGETVRPTDQNGRVTIGIAVAPGNGSNGSGGVSITAWFETSDNDDPDTNEPKDSSTKSWTPGTGEPGVPAGVTLDPPSSTDDPGESVTYTATVSDGNGDPVAGATVAWTEEGQGEFVSQETTTDSNGQATAVVTSNAEGDQSITATAEPCGEGFSCTDTSQQTWANNTCPGFENDSRNQIVGTDGPDRLEGTEGDDIICGFGARDTILGHGGDDLLLGGGGKDIVRGNDGNDELRGNAGNDTLSGGNGADVLLGQRGYDTLKGNSGNDRIVGAGGNDIIQGGSGRDRATGGGGKDVIRGFYGNDRLFGGGGNDVIKGQGDNDTLRGGGGDDNLNGGGGQDSCNGGPGDDTLRRCE